MDQYKSIAIDGPSGAGKTSLAKLLAVKLGFLRVDTGAMYRAIGLNAFRKGIDPSDAPAVEAMLPDTVISLSYDDEGTQHVWLNGEDVSAEIRRPEISMYASAVSALSVVRAFLLNRQRDLAKHDNVIMDGRDIGTVILPNADVKIFLTASDEERARRRWLELKEKGMQTTFEEVLDDMRLRDKNDSTRAEAPLKPAEDSVIVDTTELNIEQSFKALYDLIVGRLGL
ncbi:MAG: (d)CMP kinase [Oscillospiraceae bacterium]|nr:(d)CMP kinase [Oscillospiraceae bacterium]